MKNRKISNIKNYKLVNGKLFLANAQREVFNEDKSILLNQFYFDVSSLMSIEDFLIIPISENLGNTFVFNTISNYGFKLKEGCTFKNLKETILELQEINSDFSSFNLKIYDLIKEKYIFQPVRKFREINHLLSLKTNLYFSGSDNIIYSFHLPTETTLWQYSVAELGADKVSRILGVFGQVLVVVCEMPKSPKSILVGLDITDGSELFTVPLTLYQMNNNLFFYEANNSIVSIIGEYLWEFSLSTFQVIREKYLPEVFNTEDVHIQVYLATLQGDSIYFAASEFGKSMSSAIVGIFDLKKELLIDYIDLKPNGKFCMGGNSCPQLSGNKIYVLDTKKTLHILEREDG
jgi:hypothetical protein